MRKLLVVIVFVAAACSQHPINAHCTPEGDAQACRDAVDREHLEDWQYGG